MMGSMWGGCGGRDVKQLVALCLQSGSREKNSGFNSTYFLFPISQSGHLAHGVVPLTSGVNLPFSVKSVLKHNHGQAWKCVS